MFIWAQPSPNNPESPCSLPANGLADICEAAHRVLVYVCYLRQSTCLPPSFESV